MPDFDLAKLPDLLARLDAPVPTDGAMSLDEDEVERERREAAAAIRALMARGVPALPSIQTVEETIRVAVAAEREACAKACEDQAYKRGIESRDVFCDDELLRLRDKQDGAMECAEAIRARGAA